MLKNFINRKFLYCLIVSLIMLIGIFLRTNLFLKIDVFEDDECRLVLALLDVKSVKYLFLPLFGGQSAPPFFSLISYILANVFGYAERALHLIPYLAGIAGMFCFYKLCREYFKRKLSVIFAVGILALSFPLVAYSSVFKQYSLDVLVGILCLYFFPKINFKDLSTKKFVGLTSVIVALPLISLPSLFFIGGFFLQNIVKNLKDKEFYKKFFVLLTPFLIVMLLYYIFNLHPSQLNMEDVFPNYWNEGFLSLSLKSWIKLFAINFKFSFIPNNLLLFMLILFIWGIASTLLDKKNPPAHYILYTFSLVLFASLLNLYPWLGRVGLYTIPLLILLIVKPIDCSNYKKWNFYAALLFFVISFYKYDFNYLKELTNIENIIYYSPLSVTKVLQEKFDPQKDIILINGASASSYLFYSSKLHFDTDRVYQMPLKEELKEYLDGLETGRSYWIYLVKDYGQAKIFPMIFEWLEGQNVKYRFDERDSHLIYIER